MKSFLVIILIIAFSVQSCKSHKSRNPIEKIKEAVKDGDVNVGSLNYKFDLADDWQRFDTTIHGVYVCALINTDNTYIPRITIFTEFMHGLSHHDYFAEAKKGFANITTGFKVLEEGQFTISNNDCLWLKYNNSHTHDGIVRETLFYSVDIKGISYDITAACNLGGLKKYRGAIEKIVKSFSVN